MGKLLSTIEINNKINAKLIKNPHLEYLGFENDKWIGANHTRLVIRCKIHNIICKSTFSNFIKKDRYLCSECVKEDRKYLFPDFTIKNDAIIEYDGKQHYEFIKSMQKTYSRFIDQVNRDNYLVQYCKDNNIRLLRISYKDNNRLEEVIKAFLVDGIDISTKVEPKLLPVPITYYKSDYGR